MTFAHSTDTSSGQRPHLLDGVTVTLTMPTRPAARLRSRDRRRLAHLITDAERRLADACEPSPGRARTVRRLWALAERAGTAPSRRGLALVATPHQGRHLTLENATMSRTIVGPEPSFDEIVRATWGLERLGVLLVSSTSVRLVLHDAGATWEPVPPCTPRAASTSELARMAATLVASRLPSGAPLVMAGDHAGLEAVLDHDVITAPIAAVVPRPAAPTSPDALVAIAERAVRRALDHGVRDVLEDVALAHAHGRAVCGIRARVLAETAATGLLVLEGPQ